LLYYLLMKKKSTASKRVTRELTDPGPDTRPPMVVASPSFNMTQRYFSSGTSLGTVCRGDMLDRLVMATGATTGYRLISGVKLNWISVYAPGSLTGVRISIQWNAEFGVTKIISDLSTSTAYPASFIKQRPPKGSTAGFWSQSGTDESTVLFNYDFPANAIVDVNFSFVLADPYLGFPSSPSSVTIANGVAGALGVPYLDHTSPAAHVSIVDWVNYT